MPETKWSQAEQRTFRVFRDQHGRKWGADVENKTQEPCGPLAIITQPPVVAVPPVLPPKKYIVVSNRAAAELRIDYDAWLRDLDSSNEEFELFALQQAHDLYGDAAAEKLEEMPPALQRRIYGSKGDQRLPRQVVIAMREGDAWVLGLSTQRPPWAEKYLPIFEEEDETAFLREGLEEQDDHRPGPGEMAPGLQAYHDKRRRAKELGLDVGPNPTTEELDAALASAEGAPAGVAEGVDDSWKE